MLRPTRSTAPLIAVLACGAAVAGAAARDEAPVATAAPEGAPPPAAPAAPLAGDAPRALPDPPRPSEGVHFRFTADAWFPRLDGNTANGGATIDLGDGLDLDATEATFDGVAELRLDRWQLAISGFSFSTSGSVQASAPQSWGGVTAAAGDTVQSSFDLDSAALEVGYALWRPLSDQPWPWSDRVRNVRNSTADGDYRGNLSLAPFAGGRWLGIDQDFRNASTGGAADFSSSWLALYGGLRLELAIRVPREVPFLDRIVIGAGGAFGGVLAGGSGTYYQVRAGLDLFITHNIAISGGYQLIELDADEDGFELDGGLQGLWVGATIWF